MDPAPSRRFRIRGKPGERGFLHVFPQGLSTPPAENDDIHQGVGPQPVAPVNRDAGAFPGRIEARQNGVLLVNHHLRVGIGGDAPHRVMGGRLNRDGALRRVDPQIGLDEIGDVREFFVDHLRIQMGQVQINVIFAVDPPPFPNLPVDGAGDHVPWS